MSLLSTLAEYMCGEFDNREQAIDQPIWFVHLRMWQRPTQLFQSDSITLFAEQSNILQLEKAYRQRLMRLRSTETGISVQYYAFKDPSIVKGAGQNPALLEPLTEDTIDLLPGCVLDITQTGNTFTAKPPANSPCYFTYEGNTIQVSLGFEASDTHFLSYDKGLNPATGQNLWGALMGPYTYTKRHQF